MFGPIEKAVNRIRKCAGRTSGHATDASADSAPVLIFDGAMESTVYTYRSHVFDNMRITEECYVEVLGFDLTIDDPITGSFVNTADSDLAAVSYRGAPFGTLSRSLSFLKGIAAKGYIVRVKIKMVGYYDAINGIPDLVAKTADPRLIRLWTSAHENDPSIPRFDEHAALEEVEDVEERFRCLKISERSGIEITDRNKVAWMYPSEKTWLAGNMPKASFDIKPNFKVLEVPVGSKAKPHILVMDGNIPLLEISARNSAYATIAANLGNPCDGRVIFNYYGEDGGDDVRIVVRFD